MPFFFFFVILVLRGVFYLLVKALEISNWRVPRFFVLFSVFALCRALPHHTVVSLLFHAFFCFHLFLLSYFYTTSHGYFMKYIAAFISSSITLRQIPTGVST